MKIKGSYNLTAGDHARVSLLQRMLIVSLIAALMVASLSVTGVFAAKGDPQQMEELAQDWSNKIAKLNAEIAIYNSFQLTPAAFLESRNVQQAQALGIPVTGEQVEEVVVPFNKLSDWQKAQIFLDKYRFAMSQAQTVIAQHSGFDANGQVTDEKLAKKSVQDLAMYLRMLSVFRERLGMLQQGTLVE